MPDFCHLHCHTQYSLLDGAARISDLVKKAKTNGMKAIAITDHGNMFGVPRFVSEALKEGIIPIVGSEFYLAPGHRSDRKDPKRFHQVLLAKNQLGYKNLSKLSSLGYIEGFYYKPRIDKELIRQYHEGLIATTCCLAGEIPRTILNKGESEAEKLFKEWLSIFGDDYYIELMRHGLPEQDQCNKVLIKWSKKYNVKIIATNDVHFLNQQDVTAQDILVRIQTNLSIDDKNKLNFNDQYFFKNAEQMAVTFADLPESIENTMEVLSKITPPELKRDVLLPIYQLPEGFINPDEYLKHLTYDGAKKRYPEINSPLNERIDFELKVIKDMGFAGYFLIVQDFITAAKRMGVIVGPGRGSAAGSVVAYCNNITNIDPIRYDLLFERFLNPERISMPDIDIDFDDLGRQKVIDYVAEKYGKNQVAQIITFGTMAARMAIKDVARVLKLPLSEAERLSKLIPEELGTTIMEAIKQTPELAEIKKDPESLLSKTLQYAEILEGCSRHTGLHAAGVIIAPDNLMEYIPLSVSKDSNLLVTQFDGNFVEHVGMLKMDFLGLKTLSIIKDVLLNIEKTKGITIDIDQIPLDDLKTFGLFQKGETVGIFQFESEGMRQYLKELKPTGIEDLIAMNALYRPGPIDSIPTYISRKNNKTPITYPHPLIEPILKPTYGVMVYQEQVMTLVQQLGGFTRGQADTLRKAMSKKNMPLLEKQRVDFVKGCQLKKMDSSSATSLFDKMAKFGEYGFNRSHSACYAILAYQTAYLKANYPAEYMAAVLTHNINNIKNISIYLDECKAMNIPVLGPDINESEPTFIPNKKGVIRIGLAAVKGVGEVAVQVMIKERNQNGPFKDFFDFIKRVTLRTVNKKSLDSLSYSGAFDSLKTIHRAQFFYLLPGESQNLIEKSIHFASNYHALKNSTQISLFGNSSSVELSTPLVPNCETFNLQTILKYEKEYIGFYISGHPLDEYKLEIDTFCTCFSDDFTSRKNQEVNLIGMVLNVKVKTDKNGNSYGIFDLEDRKGHFSFNLFTEDYLKFKHFFIVGNFLFLKGKIVPKYKNADALEFKPNQIFLLSEVLPNLTKKIQVIADVNRLNQDAISDLEKIIKKFSGKCILNVNLNDTIEKMNIELSSIKLKISPDKEFFKTISAFPGLSFKIYQN